MGKTPSAYALANKWRDGRSPSRRFPRSPRKRRACSSRGPMRNPVRSPSPWQLCSLVATVETRPRLGQPRKDLAETVFGDSTSEVKNATLTLCHRLLQASEVFGPPDTMVLSNRSEISLHTSGLKPLSDVLPESLCLNRMLTNISVSRSVQWADFFLSLIGVSDEEADMAAGESRTMPEGLYTVHARSKVLGAPGGCERSVVGLYDSFHRRMYHLRGGLEKMVGISSVPSGLGRWVAWTRL